MLWTPKRKLIDQSQPVDVRTRASDVLPMPAVGGFKSFLPGNRVVRPDCGLPRILGKIGTLELRLARTASDIRRAQRLRYRVFFEEMAAIPSTRARLSRRDIDPFDRLCDHLIVVDTAFCRTPLSAPRPHVVGTYRLLRQEIAERNGGFYSAHEYDIRPLLSSQSNHRLLELGRSCVLKPYRNKRTVELLWAGIWRYVQHHDIGVMFGCASLEGVDPAKLALPLSFLHHTAQSPLPYRVCALPGIYASMNRMPAASINPKEALHALPPLIKGYLRLGATFGDGAVVDRQFGTTDVFVVIRVADISQRYIDFYGSEGSRETARE